MLYKTCENPEPSPVTQRNVCYTVESLRYAQSSYFVAVVCVQWSNIFSCKSRKTSLIYCKMNYTMIAGVIFETLICLFLMLTPGVQLIFGGRPLSCQLFFSNAMTFSMLLFIWEEVRKYLIRNFPSKDKTKTNWFEKHAYW